MRRLALCPMDIYRKLFSALGGTRTPDLLVRSEMLYPIELRALGEAG
jgi:hypothetical protein